MKFRDHLTGNILDHWRDKYIEYEYLKSLMGEGSSTATSPLFSPPLRSTPSVVDADGDSIIPIPVGRTSDIDGDSNGGADTSAQDRLSTNSIHSSNSRNSINSSSSSSSSSSSNNINSSTEQMLSSEEKHADSSSSSSLTEDEGTPKPNRHNPISPKHNNNSNHHHHQSNKKDNPDTEIEMKVRKPKLKKSISIKIEKFLDNRKSKSNDKQCYEGETFQEGFLAQLDKVNHFFIDRFTKFKKKTVELCNMIQFLSSNSELRTNRNINYVRQQFIYNSQNLTILLNYRKINMEGFEKLLKKLETKNQILSIHLNTIYQNKSVVTDDCSSVKHADQVKQIFSRFFTGNNQKMANSQLNQNIDKEKDGKWLIFQIGLLMGLSIVLGSLVIYNYRFYYPHDSPPPDSALGWLLFRITLLPILLGTSFSIMSLFWERAGINYEFIFELKPDASRSSIKYFRGGMVFIFFWLLCLYFYIDTSSYIQKIPPISFPILFMLVSLFVGIMPFPIFEMSTRFWILKRIGKVISAPFVPVRFSDFFMSVQLLSLGEFLFNIQSMVCIFNKSGLDPSEAHFCTQSAFFAFPLLNALPYYWRVMQCFRRYYETRRFFPHMTSAIRSIISIIVLILSYIALQTSETNNWNIIKLIWFNFNILGSFYKWYADMAVDWGFLLNFKTNKAWPLREKLLYKKKIIYYIAMILDLFLRFLWLLVFAIRKGTLHRLDNPVFLFFFSMGEVIWASQFIYFRVESEHCLAADHYSTFYDIPIPFSEQYNLYIAEKQKQSLQKQKLTQKDSKASLEKQDSVELNDLLNIKS
ncbi:hypothetical protein CYY_005956 [Polysphondylium violaceum]|uniref:SPX domain-containing protein n=1 Tax=Polysphondylium violaceum TaxID=133409 RepID=A0A8J4PTF7_9MYCE|nr:hypothetical protein CYY_005956 [Polysphondylium violaceum]